MNEVCESITIYFALIIKNPKIFLMRFKVLQSVFPVFLIFVLVVFTKYINMFIFSYGTEIRVDYQLLQMEV